MIITMGSGDACPVYPGKKYLDWDLPDPAGKSVDEVRPIIDDIDQRVRAFLAELVGGQAMSWLDGTSVLHSDRDAGSPA